ncbi:MAG: DUF6323 family protein [Syntrophomonas sp.]
MIYLDIYRSMGGLLNQSAICQVLMTNQKTQRHGLILTADEAREIMEAGNLSLRNYNRVEIDIDVIRNMILTFCDSPYMNSQDYASTIIDLVDIFYYVKNESEDRISDNDLINIMKDFFDKSCRGSTELLKNRELALLTRILKQSSDYYLQEE